MKLGSIKYLTGEGFKNTWVNRLMSLASIGVLVACMVVIGLAILISENVNLALGKLEKQNVVMVYMQDYSWALYGDKAQSNSSVTSSINEENSDGAKDDSTENDSESSKNAIVTEDKADENGIKPSDYIIHDEAEAKELCNKIAALENVDKVEFVSSAEGLENVTDTMLEGQKEYFSFLNDEYGNPLPMAAKVTMKNMENFDATVNEIAAMHGVDTIRSQGDLAEKISAVKSGISVAGFWIISILMMISLVIVSNTIRVTMYNRKLEISIMKAVGATNTFIRIPFIVEGMIIGLVSALLSEGVLYFCYRVATETICSALGTTELIKYSEVAWMLFGVFVIIGLAAGFIGSFIMIGKYLRKEGSEFAAI